MRTPLTTFAVAVALAAIVVGAQTDTRSASITGTVVRFGTTDLVEGAAVVLIDDFGSGPNRTVTTTASGEFAFTGLPAGRYELAVTKAGLVRGAWGADKPERIGRQIVLATDQHLADLRVPLFAGAVVSGTLWSPDNTPVARARITALRRRYLSGGRTTIASEAAATTDDRGRFRIFGLPPGDYVIATVPLLLGQGQPTFFPGTNRFDAAQGVHLEMGDERLDADIRVSPIPTNTVHIQVRTEDGTSLAGWRVQIGVGVDDELSGLYGSRALTGTDVMVAELPPGPHRISASAAPPPTATATGTPTLSGSATVEVTGSSQQQEAVVVVKRVAKVSGSVSFRSSLTPPRTNVGSARIWLTAVGPRTDRPRYDTAPNVTSQFTLPAVPPGRYQINAVATVAGGALQPWTLRTVTRDGQPVDGRMIDVGSDDVTTLELTLIDDLAVFSGSLQTSDGRPAPPHFIVIVAMEADAAGALAAYHARPALDGSFRIGGVLEGAYAVVVVEDVRPDDLNNPEILKQLRQSSVMTLAFTAGEEKRQNLQTRDPHPPSGPREP